MSVVYDAGALIAAERNDRRVWADHRVRLELGVVPRTTAPVVAQVIRTSQQAQLHRFLRGCEVEAFVAAESHEVGSLLARAGTADVIDAHLVITAARHSATVLTSDLKDLHHLTDHLPTPVRVQRA